MPSYYYHPEIKLLLIRHSSEKEEMLYDFNANRWELPKIGPRPPYYTNPQYTPYYPIL